MEAHQAPLSLDSPGKNTGVGCHFLLQCMKVKSESEVAQSCPTLIDPMDCSPPGSSVHGIFQARVLEWGVFFLGFSLKMTDTFSGAPCPQLIARTSSISTVSAVNAAVDGITRIVLQWRGLQCAVIILPRWLSGQDQFLDLGQESVC